MNKQPLGLYRTHSTSHFQSKGSFSDRPSFHDNYFWSSRIRAQGVLLPLGTDRSQSTSLFSNTLQSKQDQKRDSVPTILNMKEKQGGGVSESRERTQERDLHPTVQRERERDKEIRPKEISTRQLYEKLNSRNKRILELEKEIKIIVTSQCSNHQLIHKLEGENSQLRQAVSVLKREQLAMTREIDQNHTKDEEIRKDIFIEIQKLQKALQTKQKEIYELKKYSKEKVTHDLELKLNQLQVNFEKEQEKANQKLSILQKVNKDSQVELDHYQKEVDALKKQLERRGLREDKWEGERRASENEIKRLEAEGKKMREVLQEYHQSRQELEERYNELYSEYEQVHKSNRDYQREISNRNIEKEKSRYYSDQKDIIGRIHQLRDENERLKHLLDDASVNMEGYQQTRHNLLQLQARVMKFNDRTNWLLGSQGGKGGNLRDSRVNELRERVKSLRKQNTDLKFEVNKLMKKSHNTNEKGIQTESMESKLIDSTRTDRDEFQRRIKVYVGEIQKLNFTCEEYQMTIKQYQGRIKEYQSSMLKLKSKYSLNSDAAFFKGKNVELEERVEKLLVINGDLREQLERHCEDGKEEIYRHQIKMLEERLASVQLRLDESMEERIQLEQTIAVLEIQNHVIQNSDEADPNSKPQLQDQKLAIQLQNALSQIKTLEQKVEQLKQIVNSHEIQNQRLLQQNLEFGEQLRYNSMESDVSESNKYLQLEFEKLNEVIENLKGEGLKIVDAASEIKNGGEIVERIMQRMRGIDNVLNSLNSIRAHMESSYRNQRYSIVIR